MLQFSISKFLLLQPLMDHLELFANKPGNNEEYFDDEAYKYIKSGTNVLLDVIKSTLGPKGTMKILQGQQKHAITNDGATILGNLRIDSPSARVIIDSSKAQDFEEGDGTTSIAILAALIVKHAYESKIKPIKLINGLTLAIEKVEEILNHKKVAATDEDIRSLVKTTLNSKILNLHLSLYTDICIKAIDNLDQDNDLSLISIIKGHGDLSESKWIDGIVLEKNICYKNNNDITNKLANIEIKDDVTKNNSEVVLFKMNNPKILVANTALDFDKIKIFTSKIQVNSISELEKIETAEKERLMDKVNNICKLDFDIFINRQIIYDFNMQLLLKHNKVIIENADFDGVEKLGKVLGGKVLSHFYEAHDQSIVGTCKQVEKIQIKDKYFIKFTGCPNKGSSTIMLFASSEAFLEEAERSIHDALCVLKRIKNDKYILLGGGNTEIMLAMELLKYSQEIKTVESEGVAVFSKALFEFVEILTENCGFDPKEFKSSITSLYNTKLNYTKNIFTQGLDIKTGKPACMKTNKITEGYTMKLRVLKAALESAQSLLKVNVIVKINST